LSGLFISYPLMRRFDAAVHVLLITGAGDKFFCAGADISMLEKAVPYFKYGRAL
jgi:enoyl-CoA hydratase/carnithine racemase